MGLLHKFKMISKISFTKFIYYNWLCSKVKRKGKGFIVPFRGSVIDMAAGAKIILEGDSHFMINAARPDGSHTEAFLIMRRNATLTIRHSAQLCYKATIEIHENAEVDIGSAYINSDAVILAAKKIQLGDECLISRMVFIYDADHHPIVNEQSEQINLPKPVILGNHVWIGLQTVIVRGSKIGDGAMIAANSLVGGKIKAGTMASGNPARSYSEIKWKV